jgi:hypothetical protein
MNYKKAYLLRKIANSNGVSILALSDFYPIILMALKID